MVRYIDAEKLKAENRKHFPLLSLRCELNHIINEIPTADVVEVVRCGECKHLMSNGRCFEFADDEIRPSASDYCSYGERREE